MKDYHMIKKVRTSFGENLKKILREKGKTNISFADDMNVNLATVDQWLYYGAEPRLSNIIRICNILGVTPNDLIKGDNEWQTK